LNRRSTARYTRRRSGLNKAAAARVKAATAAEEETVSRCVVISTRPVYTPTSSAVTIAYASVRLMIRSMSYSQDTARRQLMIQDRQYDGDDVLREQYHASHRCRP